MCIRDSAKGERYFPHEFFQMVLKSGKYKEYYQIDPKNSWMLAALEKNVPIVVPGWEDSTLGNMYAAAVIRGDVKNVHTVRSGIEYMTWLAEHYTKAVSYTHLDVYKRQVLDWRHPYRDHAIPAGGGHDPGSRGWGGPASAHAILTGGSIHGCHPSAWAHSSV